MESGAKLPFFMVTGNKDYMMFLFSNIVYDGLVAQVNPQVNHNLFLERGTDN